MSKRARKNAAPPATILISSTFTRLGDDVWPILLGYLTSREIITKVALICKPIRASVLSDNAGGWLWEQRLKEKWPSFERSNFFSKYERFVTSVRLDRNWINGKHRISVLKGHDKTVTCVSINGQTILSGSRDRTIKLWRPVEGSRTTKPPKRPSSRPAVEYPCMHTFTGHKGEVLTLYVREADVWCGDSAGDIKSWDMETGTNTKTISDAHNGHVNCLEMHNTLMFSGGGDGVCRLWDIRMKPRPVLTVLKNRGGINCIRYEADYQHLFVGTGSKSLSLLDVRKVFTSLETAQKTAAAAAAEHVYSKPHLGPVNAIEIYKGYVVSASDDRRLRIFEKDTGTLVTSIMEGEREVTSIKTGGNRLVTGSLDRLVKIWSLEDLLLAGDTASQITAWRPGSGTESTQPLHILKGHTHVVYGVDVNETKIASASRDHTVRVWDFSV